MLIIFIIIIYYYSTSLQNKLPLLHFIHLLSKPLKSLRIPIIKNATNNKIQMLQICFWDGKTISGSSDSDASQYWQGIPNSIQCHHRRHLHFRYQIGLSTATGNYAGHIRWLSHQMAMLYQMWNWHTHEREEQKVFRSL